MSIDRTNLLPASRARIFARDYFVRVGVVALVLATLLVLVASVLRISSYVLLTSNLQSKELSLARSESGTTTDTEAFSARIASLTSSMSLLTALKNAPSASVAMRELLAIPQEGIAISSIAYTLTAGKPRSVILTGTAETRDALRAYHLALQKSSLIRSADLPVSFYAKDSDISFTMNITLAP